MDGIQPQSDNGAGVPAGVWPTLPGLSGPLAGLKVLDLSRVLAGPWATMVLGDMGADVIKVESASGDATRGWGPPFVNGTAVYYLTANRNKRSVVLDLSDSADRDVARALAAQADVLVENFRSGRAGRFGLSYEDLQGINPRCVYCSITGFGSGSSREDEPAYDLVVQAIGGMMGVTGVDGEPPIKVGVATADLLAGLHASSAILAALFERDRTGVGRRLEVGLLDTQIAGLANQALNWLAAGYNPPRLGSDHPNVAPYGAFSTRTRHIVVAVGNDRQFAALAAVVGCPHWLDDDRFSSNADRVANRETLRAELEEHLRKEPAELWLARMRERSVPCAPVLDVAEVFEDTEVRDRTVTTVASSVFGAVAQVQSPIRIDGEPTPNMYAPPGLGEHTADVVEHVRRHIRLHSDAAGDRGRRL
jgi:crotonobetainyl-CoA:carnitine CoA-transferase CaiB-like acyl-CoA transferase